MKPRIYMDVLFFFNDTHFNLLAGISIITIIGFHNITEYHWRKFSDYATVKFIKTFCAFPF